MNAIVTEKKVGILLLNLGTPDDPSTRSVRRYLKQFLLDYRVIDLSWAARQALVRFIIAPFRAPQSAKLYKDLWTENGSPIKIFGYSVKEKLQAKLGNDYVVSLGMRYQNPSIESALDELKKSNVRKIVVFPLFPQYASASTGSALEEAMTMLAKWQTIPELHFMDAYFDHPRMIEVFANNARKMGLENYDHFLFSFHGIPQRQLVKADCNNYCLQKENCCAELNTQNVHCYSAQCHATAKAIANQLGLSTDQYSIGFQSRLGRAKWTEPFTPDVLKDLYNKGKKRLMVFSPSFVADCLETTIEIGDEYKEDFLEWGGERLDLVESLNDQDEWIDAIHDLLETHL
ncbi:MAG: ferrochelatase [Saprospiraceae bacterium]|nr:ferrochelatase [Saprospiraceae bacterium]